MTSPHWRPATRFAFRFFCAYLVVAWLPEAASALGMSGWGAFKDSIGRWAITHVLGLPEHSLVPPQPAGGTWLPTALAAILLVLVSLAVAAFWTAIDRSRAAYPRLLTGVHAIARFTLAYFLLGYGLAKILPSQFGPPGFQLVPFSQQVAQLSPQQLLWAFMGASREYTIFAGMVETAAALFLLSRRTVTLGALLAVAAMTHVVVLNFAYDVVVKVLASQMLLLAVCVLAPDLPRLATLFLLDGPVSPRPIRPMFTGSRHARLTQVAGLVLAVWMVADQWGVARMGADRKNPATQVELHGMWDVTASTELSPWQRLVIPYEGTAVTISPSESASLFTMALDASARTIILTPNTLSRTIKPGPNQQFRYEQTTTSTLVLHNPDTGAVTHLRLAPLAATPLMSHRHRWDW